MTQDEIIEMAREAGYLDLSPTNRGMELKELEAFANLVAAKERESYKHDMEVLTNALWKACGDDEEVVKATIESQGTLLVYCMDGYYSDCFDVDPINKQTEEAIAAIKEALAQLALDAKAENARKLGLDYELENKENT